MTRHVPLILIVLGLTASPAFPQMGQLGPSGDFRVDGRPGTAPTGGPPGGPSLPPGPAMFRDSLGGRTPDEVLRSLNQELGKSSAPRPVYPSGTPSTDLSRELESPSDRMGK